MQCHGLVPIQKEIYLHLTKLILPIVDLLVEWNTFHTHLRSSDKHGLEFVRLFYCIIVCACWPTYKTK